MNIKDILWLSLKGMSKRKVRTALTVLSVIIGVAAIVALVSLVAGISASISNSLSSIGPTSLFIIPGRGNVFTVATIASIETLPNVSTAIPLIRTYANITVSGQTTTATIIGVDNNSLKQLIGSVNIYQGNTYNQTIVPEGLVGYDIAFPSTLQTNPSISIDQPVYLTQQGRSGSKTTTIIPVGILNSYGSSILISPDTSIFVPVQIAQQIAGSDSYNLILVKATNTSSVSLLDTLLTDIYGNTATIFSVQQLAQTVSSITGSLGLLLGSIAGISLIVAGISILSIMMVSVKERTHEIGILKSIGFKKIDILTLFISEALIIGILGGCMGVVVGTGGSYILPAILSAGSSNSGAGTAAGGSSFGTTGVGAASRPGQGIFVGGGRGSSGSSTSPISLTPIITPSIIFIAISIAILVSVAASLYPSWKAARVDPIKALRYE